MVLIPLYDKDPLEGNTVPVVTYGLIALNALVFLLMLGLPEDGGRWIVSLGILPRAVSDGGLGGLVQHSPTFLTYMFIHVGWMHIIGNMLFLWVFGDNVEDAMGSARFLVFYLLCGAAGGAAYVLGNPQSNVPVFGASGAIAGILAAYLMLRPCAKIEVLIFVFPKAIDAYWVLGAWVVLQLWHIAERSDDGVAWAAHGGGLLAGALLIPAMRRPGVTLFKCVHPADRPRTP